MKINNIEILKIFTIIFAFFHSHSANSSEFDNASYRRPLFRDHFINFFLPLTVPKSPETPEIDRQINNVIQRCQQFGTYPSEQEDEVYWSVSPITDRRTEKNFKLAYLRQIEAEEEQIKSRYFEEQQIIRERKEIQEYQQKAQIEKRRREEEQRKNALHNLYEQNRRLSQWQDLPDSPESCIVVWDDSSPVHSILKKDSIDSLLSPSTSIAADDEGATSHEETESRKSFGSDTLSSRPKSLNDELDAEFSESNKENLDNQIVFGTSKRPHTKIETLGKPTNHLFADFDENATPTQIDTPFSLSSIISHHSQDETKSPPRKVKRNEGISPLLQVR